MLKALGCQLDQALRSTVANGFTLRAEETMEGVGGSRRGAGEAPDLGTELNANAAPAAAAVVPMNSRLVCSLIIAFTRARLIVHLIFNQNLFANGHF